ncbi:MAG: DUF3098 domain-containing protein [Crocinitomicaceae bacterium]|nr:DUF3098 domain-containing protein [Crocinitomicaceae bacterium]
MSTKNTDFAFDKENYKFLFIGFGVTILGFILMIGGASEDPNEFNADELYSFVRITLAPFLVIAGYAVVIYAIMKGKKGAKKNMVAPTEKKEEATEA